MKKTQTRRALLMSALSLLLCVSMLVGSTFAWFTDSVVSANNVIKSGNLDIEVQYTLDGTTWKDLQGAQDLFQKDLWEPGHTEVVALKIENKGSLALKYIATMNIVDEIVGKTKDGKDIVLSDILTVSTLTFEDAGVDPVFGINIAEKSIEEAFKSENGIGYGAAVTFKSGNVLEETEDLLPGGAQYVVVKVDMAETVGNEANHDGVNKPSITFGINVLATQKTYEKDSFGPDYDENATYGPYVELEEGGDLLAALKNTEADKPLSIKLMGNVEWPTEGHHGVNDVTPASSVVIDGNGYTITAVGSGVTPLGDDKAPMTLKNVKIVDNSVSYNEAAWELSYLEVGGKALNCVNVEFADPIQVESDNATFTGCSFVGHNDKNSTSTTQYGVWVYNGNSTYTNCTFTGTRSMKICDQYDGEVGTVVIDGCTFNKISEKPGVCIDDEDAQDMDITIKNSTFIGCKAGDQGLYVYETDNTVPTVENNTVVASVSAAETLAAAIANGGNIVLEEDVTISLTENAAGFGYPIAFVANSGKPVVLDLNGHTIKVKSDKGDSVLLHALNTDVTIKNGHLVVDGGKDSNLIWAKGTSTVTIEDGTFESPNADAVMIYVSDDNGEKATVNINGGTFTSNGATAQNHINIRNHGMGKVVITGGTFNFNPDWSVYTDVHARDDAAHITIADGYHSVDNGNGTWSVVAD